jgi:voltage-gated potassium channel
VTALRVLLIARAGRSLSSNRRIVSVILADPFFFPFGDFPDATIGGWTMSTALKRVIGGISFFVLTCLAGTLAYSSAGWSWMDSFYMVVITIFGVGYGEVNPIQTSGLRIVTILLIVLGYGAAAFTVGGFVQMLMEGELNRALNRRRMTKGIGELQDHIILCGFGRAGRILAKELHTAKTQFVVVDVDAAKLNEAEQEGFLIVEGNATEDDTLEQAGVRRARVLASVFPDDATNVFITLTARGLNHRLEIIAARHAW